jgi:uncharacterized protein YbjT (DUF2867 family)
MNNRDKIITIFGGSGFIGSHVVRELAKTGAKIKVIGRHATSANHLKTTGAVGQIALIDANINDVKVIENLIKGSSIVINLVGILFEKRSSTFEYLHTKLAATIAELCAKNNVERFIHISALGVDKARTSKYAKSKFNAEKEVLKLFPKATILRPSVVFGPEDNFINLFNWLSKISPILPLVGGGHTLFQPVYVGDVAKAVLSCTEIRSQKVFGKTFELGGPQQYSFKEILQLILATTGRKRLLLPIPTFIAKFKAFFLEFMPRPLMTRDQVELLKYNNIISKDNGLTLLNITPTPMETVIATYLK